jgi:hypothetical protein
MTHLLESDAPHVAVVSRHHARTTVSTAIDQRRNERPKRGAVGGY